MPRSVRVPDCHPDKPHAGQGLCESCYRKRRKAGTIKIRPYKRSITLCEHADRPHMAKGLCKQCYMKARYKQYRPIQAARVKERRLEDPDFFLDRLLRKNYGMTLSDKIRMFHRQGGRCAVCSRVFKKISDAHVDHDHHSGLVRGLLCGPCNRGIGLFKEDASIFTSAISYLHRARNITHAH